jgi:AhpD family alkylhydroperoxidase
MKKVMQQTIRTVFVAILFFAGTMSLTAQTNSAYQKAIKEIEEQFGIVPVMFNVFPDYALPGAWENFKALSGPESKIPPKYRELLQLAVAAQIPCQYCIYFHTAAAKAFGATEEEIQEAVADGAQTRHWSMILQGNQVDFEAFKEEFDAMMKVMASKPIK